MTLDQSIRGMNITALPFFFFIQPQTTKTNSTKTRLRLEKHFWTSCDIVHITVHALCVYLEDYRVYSQIGAGSVLVVCLETSAFSSLQAFQLLAAC